MQKARPHSPASIENLPSLLPSLPPVHRFFRSNRVGLHGSRDVAHDEGIGLGKGLGVMFACRAEFSGHPPAGPQHLGTVMGSAFWTNTFSRFFAQADSLNVFNFLFGAAVSFFCFHCQSPCWSWDLGVVSFKRRSGLSGSMRFRSTPICILLISLAMSVPEIRCQISLIISMRKKLEA